MKKLKLKKPVKSAKFGITLPCNVELNYFISDDSIFAQSNKHECIYVQVRKSNCIFLPETIV